MSTHSTPWGFTFELTTPELVSEGKRRPVAYKLVEVANRFDDADDLPTDPDAIAAGTQAEAKVDLDPEEMQLFDELNDLVAVALLTSWSAPTPVSLEALTNLPSREYAAIRSEVAPFVTKMLPDFSPSPEEGTPTTP